MSGYLINFSIYTTAMVGVLFLALFTFKKFSNSCFSKKSSLLNIEDTMRLSARKSLYIIKAKNERFLIAADLERTSLIAKLDTVSEIGATPPKEKREDKSTKLSSFDGLESIDDFTSVIDFTKEKAKKGPMMRELANKLKNEM